MTTTRTSDPQGGFTLVEVAIVLAILVPILTGISVTTANVNSAVEANNHASDVMAHCRRMSQRINKLVRPAKMSSIQVPAIAHDVATFRASYVGQWIAPSDLVWRPGIEFTAASGLLSMNAALSTTPRRIAFVMDASESNNGKDDDGDGLVDEGQVELEQNGITLAILRDVEECSFALDQRILQMRLRVARQDDSGRTHRAMLIQDFFLRNN